MLNIKLFKRREMLRLVTRLAGVIALGLPVYASARQKETPKDKRPSPKATRTEGCSTCPRLDSCPFVDLPF